MEFVIMMENVNVMKIFMEIYVNLKHNVKKIVQILIMEFVILKLENVNVKLVGWEQIVTLL